MTDPREKDEGPPAGGDEDPPGVPRWVKLSGLAFAIVVVVLVAVMVLSGGEHGPGRHSGSDPIGLLDRDAPPAAPVDGRDSAASLG